MVGHQHAHAHAELLFVLRGNTQEGISGVVHGLRPRTVCFFPPMLAHDDGYRGQAPLRHLWVSVLADHYVARVIERGRERTYRQVRSELLTPQEAGVLPGVFLASSEDSPAARNRLLAAAAVLASSLVARGRQAGAGGDAGLLQHDVVQAICRHIERTAGAGVNLAGLARIAGYSKFHFLRMFRRHTRRSLRQYVDDCRRRRVAELQREGHSQKAIAHALGFAHASAFSRWKKRM